MDPTQTPAGREACLRELIAENTEAQCYRLQAQKKKTLVTTAGVGGVHLLPATISELFIFVWKKISFQLHIEMACNSRKIGAVSA